MGKILKFLFSRIFTIGVLIVLQLILFISLLYYAYYNFTIIYFLLSFFSICFVLYLFSGEQAGEYKLLWSLVIILFPFMGGLFYILWGKRSTDWKALSKLKRIYANTQNLATQDEAVLQELKQKNIDLYKQANYLKNAANAPVYKNCKTEYFKSGEEKFASLVEELKKAEKFILMEYFIVEHGIMWDTILDILVEKVKQGVEVYFLYDDGGCVSKLPQNYEKHLIFLGIKAAKFNPLRAKMYTLMNYRDHRKITVIDGKVGYVGGINLADEYINEIEIYGHWKDTAAMIKGEGVWNLSIMFFQLWSFTTGIDIDYNKYKCDSLNISASGYVQCFGDDPLDDINVAECNYLNMINSAKEYIYITTPYLIIDSEMIGSLTRAARCGIDVRIITPGIPDKKLVYLVNQSYYKILTKAGVKIFEYTPGFIHGKMFACDDIVSVVGTINLDYRSLYLHFECGSVFYDENITVQIKEDILKTLEKCEEYTIEKINKTNIFKKGMQVILRIFAPLM